MIIVVRKSGHTDIRTDIGVILWKIWEVRTPCFLVGDGPTLFESIKSEILPSKRVMQKCRVQTVM